jgi:hypothetical protein
MQSSDVLSRLSYDISPQKKGLVHDFGTSEKHVQKSPCHPPGRDTVASTLIYQEAASGCSS